MKYVLIEVKERDISKPEFFDTEAEVVDVMQNRMAKVLGVSKKSIKRLLKKGSYMDAEGDVGISLDSAWCERYGNNFDWRIFKIEEGQILD